MWLVWLKCNGRTLAYKCEEIPLDLYGKPHPYLEKHKLTEAEFKSPLKVLMEKYPYVEPEEG
jgi:hypothetical protein